MIRYLGLVAVSATLSAGQAKVGTDLSKTNFGPFPQNRVSSLAGERSAALEHLGPTNWEPNAVAANAQVANQQVVSNQSAASETNHLNGAPTPTSSFQSLAPYSWSATPSSPLAISAGSNTITLSTCPSGMNLSHLNSGLQGVGGFYVRLPDHGSDEVALITGGTCTPGKSNGTIIVAAANPHTSGYAVTSASGGLQEAINDGCYRAPAGDSAPVTFGGEFKIKPQIQVDIYATVYISCANETVDLSGALLRSQVQDNQPTIYIGSPHFRSDTTVADVTLINPSAQPAVAGNAGPFIEVNAQHTRIFNVVPLYNWANAKASWGSIVQVDDDQAFLLDGLDLSLSFGRVMTSCTASGCPSAVTSKTGSPVGWLKHMNLSLGCRANGVNWETGNGLHISDSIIQAYPQWAIRVRGSYGTGVHLFDNIYREVGGCKNPLGVGVAGIICSTGMCVVHDGTGSSDWSYATPSCTTSGHSTIYYYVVGTYAGGHATEPYAIGASSTDGAGTCTIKWPQIAGPITGYDLLSTTGTGNIRPPTERGNYARQTGLKPSVICSGSGVNAVCSVTDTNSKVPSAYTVVADSGALLVFWPAAAVSTDTRAPGPWDIVQVDRYYQGGVVSALGTAATSVYAKWCSTLAGGVQYTDTIVNCGGGLGSKLQLSTSPVPAHSCGSEQDATLLLPFVFSSSIIHFSFASTTSGVPGWKDGGLELQVFPVPPFKMGAVICNTTGSGITPGRMALNMSVETP
jgi:hypothetical protein